MTVPNQGQVAAIRCPQCGAGVALETSCSAVCRYCGSSLVWTQPGHPAAGGDAGRQSVVRGVRLKEFVCVDSQGTGLDVFRMLVPVGWSSQGGCVWRLDNPTMPASIGLRLWNPHGAEAFEILPNLNFTWNPASLGNLFSAGQRQFGAEVRAPISAREALRQIVLPRYRSMGSGVQILEEVAQPDLPRLARSEALVSGGTADGGKVRIRYLSQQTQVDEDIFGVVEVFHYPVQTLFGVTQASYWLIDTLFSVRAEAGRLEKVADIYLAMIGSVRLNPEWYAAFKAIAQRLSQAQVQRIRNIGQIGEIYAQTGREARQQHLDDWYTRQATYDRLATDRSRQIRDVDAYYDPHKDADVELPAGYGHAWANNLGEYLVTEDPNFNPNTDSNLHWEPMPSR
jgi:hypothetical protein